MFWCCCTSPPPPPPPSIVVYVYGCNGRLLPGATVTIVTVGSGTTDSNGYYASSVPSYGTYTVTATKAKFGVKIGSATVNETGPVATVRLYLEIEMSGYACCLGCPDPVPEVLYLTTSKGTVTLTLLNAGPQCTWSGSRSIEGNALKYWSDSYMICQEDTGTYPIFHQYFLTGPGAGPGGVFHWSLRINTQYFIWVDGQYRYMETPAPFYGADDSDIICRPGCEFVNNEWICPHGADMRLAAYMTGNGGCSSFPISGTIVNETAVPYYPAPLESGEAIIDE
jgi:hypothetical protein